MRIVEVEEEEVLIHHHCQCRSLLLYCWPRLLHLLIELLLLTFIILFIIFVIEFRNLLFLTTHERSLSPSSFTQRFRVVEYLMSPDSK